MKTVYVVLGTGVCILLVTNPHDILMRNTLRDTTVVEKAARTMDMTTETATKATALDDKSNILAAARRITDKGKILLVTFINDAFLPLAFSWLCNTEGMGIHDQILIIASDNDTEQTVKRKRPEIATVAISGYSMKGHQTYTRAGYVRLCI